MNFKGKKIKISKRLMSLVLCAVMTLSLLIVGIPGMMIRAKADTWDGNYPSSNNSNDIVVDDNAKVIRIYTAAGLARFALLAESGGTGENQQDKSHYSGYSVYLENDIDMNSHNFKGIGFYRTWTSWFSTKTNNQHFNGKFYGQNHTISNLVVDSSGFSNQNRVGLFRNLQDAEIHDLTISNVSVTGTQAGTGSLIGFANGTLTLDNVHVVGGTVSGYKYVGGLVGEYGDDTNITITNCSNTADVTASNERAGGIVGHCKGFATVTGCSNSGTVSCGANDCGGIIGWIEDDASTFTNCENTGNVTAKNCAGGMFGYMSGGSADIKMYNNINRGKITGQTAAAGGMVGNINNDSRHIFDGNINYGEIISDGDDAGGIIGYNKGFGTYTNNKNYGTITSNADNAGGIVGDIQDDQQTFTNCYNTGNVTGPQSIGGIFGCGRGNNAFTFENCGNSGVITSTGLDAGGIFGHHVGGASPTFSEGWNIGEVKAKQHGGGVCGYSEWHAFFYRTWNSGAVGTYNNNGSGYHGGIIGRCGDDGNNNAKAMEDCYNWGAVSGGQYNGGLVGWVNNGGTYNIRNSYNSGPVSGSIANAIVGYGGNADSSCYYNSSIAMGTAQGTAKSSQQLIDYGFSISSNFCKNTWGVKIGSVTYYYPILNWYRNMFEFEVSFTDTPSGTDTVFNKKYNESFTTPNPSRVGYTSGDWYLSGDTSKTVGKGVNVTAGVTAPTNTFTVEQSFDELTQIKNSSQFVISWTVINYTIGYNLNGGTVSSANPATYNIETPSFSLVNPTKAGYTFTGWTGSNGSTPQANVTISKGSTGNLSYTANWTEESYTIEYNLDGGTVSSANPTSYNIESSAITLNNPVKTGYTFKGWSGTGLSGDSNTSVTIPTGSTGNRSYTANWTVNQYTITYVTDGTAVLPATVNYGADLPSATTSKNNYSFTGWTYVKEGTSEAYNGTTMPAYNLTATAQWLRPAEDDVFVIDSGLKTSLDVSANDEVKTVKSVNGDGASLENGTVYFKPSAIMNGKAQFTYTVEYEGKDYTATVTVIPATSVYYEEDSDFVTFNGGWTDASTKVEKVADTVSDVYGGLSAYDNTASTTYSLGNAKMVTVDSDNKGDKNLNAQFTFTGTGFEVYSMTDSTSGLVLIDIVNVNDSEDKYPTTMVNTYLGYSYGPLYLNESTNEITLNASGNKPVYYTDDTGAGTFYIGDYTKSHTSTRGTTDNTVGTVQANGWVQENNGSLYQVPVISRTDLEYGTYTVTISPRYSKMQSGGRSEYSFYFDSVRIYNPVDPDDTLANDVYKAANEYNPQYKVIRDLLISTDATNTEGIALIDKKGDSVLLSDYIQVGPKNETYITAGQSIGFNLTTDSTVIPEKIAIGVRIAKGGSTGTLTVNENNINVKGSTEIYKDISNYVEWEKVGNVYKTKDPVVITNSNASDSGIIISLTKIRWSFGNNSVSQSGNAPQLTFSFDKPSLLASANIINAAFSSVVYADSSAVTVEWENDSVKLGETAKLIITATTDYEKAFVDGAEIAGYTEDGSIRTWTYTFTAEELGDFMNDVTLIDVNGYETKAIATGKIKVSAPVPDIDSAHTEWENDKVTAGDTAVLKIVTPSDIVKVKVGKTEITEFTSNEDGTREFRLEMPAATAGEYKYSVIITEKYGYSSINGETPLLTVEAPENPATPENPETPENGENNDNTENTENGDKEETLSFFQKLMKAIIGLFTKIANIFKGAFN